MDQGSPKDNPKATPPYWQIGLCALLSGQSMMLSLGLNMTHLEPAHPMYGVLHGLLIGATCVVLGILGRPLIQSTVQHLINGRITLESLFTTSLCGAFTCSLYATWTGSGPIYYEVVSIVCLIYTLGKSISRYSRNQLLAEANKLEHTFDTAYVLNGTQRIQTLVTQITLSDIISVIPGSAISVDGIVYEGQGYVTETALTGEPSPVLKAPGDTLLAGSYSVDGTFKIQPQILPPKRRIDSILQTISTSKTFPALVESKANRLVQWFLPLVLFTSLGTFCYWHAVTDLSTAIVHSMSVLLVACPCALGLSIPIAIHTALWKLASIGIVSRNGQLIDALGHATHLIFDKTGTLTLDSLTIHEWRCVSNFPLHLEVLQSLVAQSEHYHHHPLAKVFEPYLNIHTPHTLQHSQFIPGKGIQATFANPAHNTQHTLCIGNLKLMDSALHPAFNALQCKSNRAHTTLYISWDHQIAGIVILQESLREGTQGVLATCSQLGLECCILTGDPNPPWATLESITVHSGLTPNAQCVIDNREDKV